MNIAVLEESSALAQENTPQLPAHSCHHFLHTESKIQEDVRERMALSIAALVPLPCLYSVLTVKHK